MKPIDTYEINEKIKWGRYDSLSRYVENTDIGMILIKLNDAIATLQENQNKLHAEIESLKSK